MTITVLEVIKRALRLCGQTGAPGRGISPEQQAEVLNFLNQMLDGWNAIRGSIFTIAIKRYTLTPSQTSYTIGPSGNFIAARPIRMLHANLVLTQSSPEVFLSLQILDSDQWALTSVEAIPTTVPVAIYNDYASPNSTLYLWGYPTYANDLQLWTYQELPNAVADTDTFELPDGYPRAIVYNLAVEIAPLYWKKSGQLFTQVKETAMKSRAAIVGVNTNAPKMVNDAGFLKNGPQRPYFNYLIGS